MRRFCSAILSAILALGLACLLFSAPFAQERESYVMRLPLGASLESLAQDKTLPLLAFDGSDYTLALTRLDDNGVRWVRVVLARGTFFYGACTLGAWEQLEGLEALQIDALFQPGRVEFAFTSLPDKQRRGALAMPMEPGLPALSEAAQARGIDLVRAAEENEPADQEEQAAPEKPAVGAGPYLLVLGLLVFLLAALILGQMFGRRWLLELRERFWQLVHLLRSLRKSGPRSRRPAALPPHIAQDYAADAPDNDPMWIAAETPALGGYARQSPIVAVKPQVREPALEPEGAPAFAEALAGATVLPAPPTEQNTLLRRILMKEEETPPPAENQEEAMRAFFLGRGGRGARLPRCHFLTVGLSNREALLQLGGESVRPLFAPNPRGQLFSLEEESGNLYLHVEYFAPPSFVLQSVLLQVCLERIFDCVDGDGNSIPPEEAVNHSIADIVPARTVRTEAGFIITEKGKLVIGEV